MEKFTCEQAKGIDLVDYLAALGHYPAKPPRGDNYWYLSPLRNENDPSFHVNRKKNVWYDFGNGKGGNLVDFGTLYHNCSVSDLLKRLSDFIGRPVTAFLQAPSTYTVPAASTQSASEKKDDSVGRITVVDVRPLADNLLLQYLEQRAIKLEVAEQVCREVDFLLYGKKHTAIGFPNNSGGFELRNSYFKGSSSPKDVTFIDHQKDDLSVFEGFFDYLSFKSLCHKRDPLTNHLILNSLVFLEKSRDLMEDHRSNNLYLDRNNAGKEATQKVLLWDKFKYRDRSKLYHLYEDLNAWYVQQQHDPKQSLRTGRKL